MLGRGEENSLRGVDSLPALPGVFGVRAIHFHDWRTHYPNQSYGTDRLKPGLLTSHMSAR